MNLITNHLYKSILNSKLIHIEGGEKLGLLDFFTRTTGSQIDKDIRSIYIENISSNVRYRNYAIQICINKIANALSMCDFQTLEQGISVRKNNWYLFNVEPNLNQNTSEFWNKLIYEMIYNDDGALVIQTDTGELIVADSYTVQEYAVRENIYSNVTINNFRFQRIFKESQVFHFKHNNSQIKRIINGIYDDYGKLIAGSIRNHNRSNAMKLVVKLGTIFNQFKGQKVNQETGEDEYDRTLDNLFQNRFKAIFGDSDTATPLEEGIEIVDLNASGNSKTSGSAANKTTRDVTAIFDDIINLVSDAFGIPRGLLKGDVADAEAITDNFVSFCVNPWALNIQNEINRKFYGKGAVLSNTKLKIITDTIKTYDPIKFANAAEALIRIRAVNPNWVRRKLREEELSFDWAEEYVLTKNYETSNSKDGEESA